MLEGPRQIAVLPRSAATTGRGRADIVAMHVSGAPESDGMHWWTNLRGDFQRYGSGDASDGVIPAIAAGEDGSSGRVVVGRFTSRGRGTIDLRASGVDFRASAAPPDT